MGGVEAQNPAARPHDRNVVGFSCSNDNSQVPYPEDISTFTSGIGNINILI
jgi:hypothetical protein